MRAPRVILGQRAPMAQGAMPMPLDILITRKDGTQIMYNIPLAIMRGHKSAADMKVDEFYIAKAVKKPLFLG